jgi:cellulose synthase/poly-beta-1,6-N-acetylglucosamine synthase-like glycosyltransferase
MNFAHQTGSASIVNKFLLSVVIPVHNLHDRYENLKSWVSQPLPNNLQIIFVIDEVHETARREFSSEILSKTINKYTLVSGNFGGPGSSRNSGLGVATGKYLAFIDSDDIPNIAEYFQLIVKMEISNADLGIGSFQTLDIVTGVIQDKSFATQSSKNNLKLLGKNPGLWRMVFTRSSIEGLEFPALRMGEDQVFIAQALQKIRKIEFMSSIVYTYCINQKSQLTKSNTAIDDMVVSVELLGKVLNDKNLKWRGVVELMFLKMFISRLLRAREAFSIQGVISSFQILTRLKLSTALRLLPACFRLMT